MSSECNKYYVVLIHGSSHDVEQIDLIAVSNFQCSGIESFSISEEIVDEILGERAYSGGDIPESVIFEVEKVTESEVLGHKYFFDRITGDQDSKEFQQLILKKFPEVKIELEQYNIEDWNELWRESFTPIPISNKLTVVPEWYKENYPKESSVYIYPGMGFGTGNHATTYLCLKLLEELDKVNLKSCLDFGCGSGILGIAAIVRKGCEVDFCDIDKDALDNCLYNLKLNCDIATLTGSSIQLRDRFTLQKKYNLVFANILVPILKSEFELISSAVGSLSYLIISGILKEQSEDILSFYLDSNKFEEITMIYKDDWSAILLKRIR